MPFFTNRKNIEQKLCTKRTIQGGIEQFVKKQSPEKLLQSKDGLKQGRIDCFLMKKENFSGLPTAIQERKKRPCKGDDSISKKKKSVKVSSKNAMDDCIVIDHGSSSDEYYTAPNTQTGIENNRINNFDEENEIYVLSSSSVSNNCNQSIAAKAKSDQLITPEEKKVSFDGHLSTEEKNTIPSSPILVKRKNKLKRSSSNKRKYLDNSKLLKVSESFSESHRQVPLSKSKLQNQSPLSSSLKENISLLQNVERENRQNGFCQDAKENECSFNNKVSIESAIIPASEPLASKESEYIVLTSNNKLSMESNSNADDKSLAPSIGDPVMALENVRFKVSSVSCDVTNGNRIMNIHAKNDALQSEAIFKLADEWTDCPVEMNDTINLLLDKDVENLTNNQSLRVDSKQNLFVLHPDLLVSGTTVSNGLGCLRRAVLAQRFKNTEICESENVSNVMLLGTIVHTIFQKLVKLNKKLESAQLQQLATEVVYDPCYLSDMVAVNSSQEKILKEVIQYLPQIGSWIADFCRPKPSAGRVFMKYKEKKNGRIVTKKYPANVAMTQVLDIEENIWSPRYGLKGKIDVTGKLKIKNRQTNEEIETVMPIEVKTGKNSHSMEHHVQVAIYSLFCDERRNRIGSEENSIAAGLLLYLKSKADMSCESLNRADLCGILTLRNQIAHYLTKTIVSGEDSSLRRPAPFPPTTTNTRLCQNCSQLRNCSLVYKSVDEPSSPSPSPDLLSKMTQHLSHLTDDDLAYFQHWMTCLFLEAREVARKDKQQRFWLKSPSQRSREGHCITGLKIANSPVPLEGGVRMLQTFKRSKPDQAQADVFQVGDMVLVSGDEPEFIAVATGTISRITDDFVTIESDRDFTHHPVDMRYTIDRHVWLTQASLQSSLGNLSMIMDDTATCNKLRNFIIRRNEPSFRRSLDFIPRSSKDEVAAMLRGLNRTQRQAIKRVLLSNDYTLVVGMPGSGKTTTIVAMIRILLLCQLRVIVTSYTHSAVDNLLIKLIKYKVNFLRLGRLSQIHPSVRPYAEQQLSRDFKDPEQLRKLYKEARVVGCTCLAVTSHVFFAVPGQARPLFDVCIVDEASQISQPTCLSPLMYATKFVLVGDHQQLPPLVVSQEAKDMGADESLFRRLTRHRSALCELTLQYRMNSEIMALSNHVTYEGRLECAHRSVAMATLQLRSWRAVAKDVDDEWLVKVLNPETCVIFLDTSESKAEDSITDGCEVENRLETSLIARITKLLLQSGCSANDVGIIAPFRKQVQLLQTAIEEASQQTVEVNTVDKYQGRDKPVILLSFVKTTERPVEGKKGELLSDWRRLNVAITRAKHKLVMVGCVRALLKYEPCKKLLDYLQEKDLVTVIGIKQLAC